MNIPNPDVVEVGWRTWTDDGRVWDSREVSWDDVPDDGIQCRIIYFSDGGKEIQMGMEFYFEAVLLTSGGTIRGTATHLEDVKTRYYRPVIKRGRWMPNDAYRALVNGAHRLPW